MTDDDSTVVPDEGQHADPVDVERRHQGRITAVVLAVVAVLALYIPGSVIGIAVLLSQVSALAEALEAEQEQSKRAGLRPVAPPPDDVKEDPDQPIPDPPPPPGPTDAQVRDAVADYFVKNPPQRGRPPVPAEIAAAVSNYLQEHPPEPGPPGESATAEQVADAVEAYLMENPPPPGPAGSPGPPGSPGPTGPTGPPGRPPTPEEIADAVRAYIEDHPLPLCGEDHRAEAHEVLTTEGPVDAVICVRVPEEED